jgi:VanZ family protein
MKILRPWLHTARIADLFLLHPAIVVVIWGELAASEPKLIENANDKLLHFIAYFGLAAMAAMGFKARRTVILACLGLIVLGGVLEIIQGFIGRDMSLYDEVANGAGVLAGGLSGWIGASLLRRMAH